LPRDTALEIAVHLPRAACETEALKALPEALKGHFRHRVEEQRSELRELFRTGRFATLVGVSVLTVCVIGAQYAEDLLGPGALTHIVEESLIILGWVANWKPLEIFLYDWWPIIRRRGLYKRLAAASVVIIPDEGHAPL
jgi:hypothetical protein